MASVRRQQAGEAEPDYDEEIRQADDKRLAALAAALNACVDAGMRVKLAHGAVYSVRGYVLPVLAGKRFKAVTVPLGPVNGADMDEVLADD